MPARELWHVTCTWHLDIVLTLCYDMKVAFHIFTNGTQTLGLNLTERFKITDEAFEKMTWPNIKQSENTEMFKSKLRYQVTSCWGDSNLLGYSFYFKIRHGDFRLRISQDEEDIQSVLDWYNRWGSVFHIYHLKKKTLVVFVSSDLCLPHWDMFNTNMKLEI